MRLLFITTGYLPMPPVKGGAINTLLYSYIKSNKKHDITVYSINNGESIEYSDEAEYRYIKSDFIYKFKTIIKGILNKIPFIKVKREYISKVINDIKKRNEENSYDLVVLENTPASVLFLNKVFPGKIILHMHNDYLNKNTKYGKEIIDNCKKIICVSNFIKTRVDEIKENTKTCVVYNGIDIDRFNKKHDKKALKDKYHIDNDSKIILYVGRLLEKKGIIELIEAFNELNLEKTKLLIVGSGDKNIINKVNNLSNKNIILLNYVSNKEIDEIYALSDLQVVPSKCNEAFGLTVLEGLSSNLKLIVTNDGAIKELILNQDAILIEKDNLKENIKKALLENNYNSNNDIDLLYKKFSKETFVDNFNNVIESIK